MDDIRNGKIYAAIFVLFLVVLAVGGYFGVYFLTKDTKKVVTKQEIVSKSEESDWRIDKSQDYIYFTNIEKKNTEREIIYQDVVFNFNSDDAKEVSAKLNASMDELKSSFELISEQDLTEEEQNNIIYKESDVYRALYHDYTRYFYKDYASLVSHNYQYDCTKGVIITGIESYVFNIKNGKLLAKDEILKLYDKNIEDVKIAIKEKLDQEQEIVEEVPQIDIVSTLNLLDDENNYALYINKGGYLMVDYLVKNVQEDYNDVIILN